MRDALAIERRMRHHAQAVGNRSRPPARGESSFVTPGPCTFLAVEPEPEAALFLARPMFAKPSGSCTIEVDVIYKPARGTTVRADVQWYY